MAFICVICGKELHSESSHKRHMATHYEEKQYMCEICGRSFNDKSNMNRHQMVHDGEGGLRCGCCRDRPSFTEMELLNGHMKQEHQLNKGDIGACPVCGLHYPKSYIKKHMKCHTSRPHSCPYCGKGLRDKRSLRDHILTHTGDRPFGCPVCDKRFAQKAQVTNHMRLHTGEKPFHCVKCDRRFRQNHHLKIHLRTHTLQKDEQKYKCIVCNRKFSMLKCLTEHMKAHAVAPSVISTVVKETSTQIISKDIKNRRHGKPVTDSLRTSKTNSDDTNKNGGGDNSDNNGKIANSTVAEKSSSSSDTEVISLQSTLKSSEVASVSYSHLCKICDKTFLSRPNLENHMKLHKGTNPYKCDICGKQFQSKYSLPKHMLNKHTEGGVPRPHKCTLCGKAFKQLNHLKDHMLSHTDKRPFRCGLCDKSYRTNSSLKKHLLIHTGELPYTCNVCTKQFRTTDSHKIHMLAHIDKLSFKCDLCGKVMEGDAELCEHKRSIHGVDCSVELNYLSKVVIESSLQSHKQDQEVIKTKVSENVRSSKKGDGLFSCRECSKTFDSADKLGQHLSQRHVDTKDFQCTVCEHRFKRKASLKKHMLKHIDEPCEGSHKCEVCDKTFKQISHLQDHMMTHSDVPRFACSYCGAKFTYRNSLHSHLHIHTGELPFHCYLCGEGFPAKIKLQMHLHKHTQDSQRFKYSICDKMFSDTVKHDQHKHEHEPDHSDAIVVSADEKNNSDRVISKSDNSKSGNSCYSATFLSSQKGIPAPSERNPEQLEMTVSEEICPRSLKIWCADDPTRIKPTIARDINKTATKFGGTPLISQDDNEKFHCIKCSSTFRKSSALRTHILIKHGKGRGGKVLSHVTPYCCPFHSFADHVSGLRCYICQHCTKRFYRKSLFRCHLNMHTSKTVFQCTECQETFRHRYSLHLHQKRKHRKLHGELYKTEFSEEAPLSKDEQEKLQSQGENISQEQNDKRYDLCCNICTEKFTEPGLWQQHLALHYGKVEKELDFSAATVKVEADVDWPGIANLEEEGLVALQQSTLTDIHECNQCGQRFPSDTSLQLHHQEGMCMQISSDSYCGMSDFVIKQEKDEDGLFSSLQVQTAQELQNRATYVCQAFVAGDRNDSGENDQVDVNTSPCGADSTCSDRKTNSVEHSSLSEVLFPCENCKQTFITKRALFSHICKKHGGRSFVCNVCGEVFSSLAGVRLHSGIHSDKRPYVCGVCGRGFKQQTNLAQHKLVHNAHNPLPLLFPCTYCQQSFFSLDELRSHEVLHLHTADPNSGKIKCTLCDEEFSESTKLRKHGEQCAQSKPPNYSCRICHISFGSLPFLTRHMGRHSLDGPNVCQYCGKGFPEEAHLMEHVVIHTGNRRYCCMVCNKRFVQRSHLNRHYRIHTGERPHECHLCLRQFRQRQALKIHLASHLRVKKLKCDFCEERFDYQKQFLTHKEKCQSESQLDETENIKSENNTEISVSPSLTQVVTEVTVNVRENLSQTDNINTNILRTKQLGQHCSEYKTNNCNNVHDNTKVFVKKDLHVSNGESATMLSKLHKQIDTNYKAVACDQCEWTFIDLRSLQLHKGFHSGERPFMCQKCGVSYANLKFLDKHSKCHSSPHECPICGKCFSSKYTIPKHIQIMHSQGGPRPFSCDKCGKSFRQKGHLKDHIRSHTGEKRYQCEVCKLRVSSNQALKKHMYRHTGERPYVCSLCDASFRQNGSLQLHMRRHREMENAWGSSNCKLCPETLCSHDDWCEHMKQHHNDQNKTKHSGQPQSDLKDKTVAVDFKIVTSKRNQDQFNKRHHKARSTKSTSSLQSSLVTRADSSNKSFVCLVCSKSFEDTMILLRHCRLHFRRRCILKRLESLRKDIGFQLPRVKVMKITIKPSRAVIKKKYTKCISCKKMCVNVPKMKVHRIIRHSGKRSYICGICSLVMTHRRLMCHMMTHIDPKSDSCCKCGKPRKCMEDHLLDAHTEDRIHRCQKCPAFFSHKAILKFHAFTHGSRKQYKCGKCGYQFLHSYQVWRHVVKHTNDEDSVENETVQPVMPSTDNIQHEITNKRLVSVSDSSREDTSVITIEKNSNHKDVKNVNVYMVKLENNSEDSKFETDVQKWKVLDDGTLSCV